MMPKLMIAGMFLMVLTLPMVALLVTLGEPRWLGLLTIWTFTIGCTTALSSLIWLAIETLE